MAVVTSHGRLAGKTILYARHLFLGFNVSGETVLVPNWLEAVD